MYNTRSAIAVSLLSRTYNVSSKSRTGLAKRGSRYSAEEVHYGLPSSAEIPIISDNICHRWCCSVRLYANSQTHFWLLVNYQQRFRFIKIFYWKPIFALCSGDVEQIAPSSCGKTFYTETFNIWDVSKRSTMWQYYCIFNRTKPYFNWTCHSTALRHYHVKKLIQNCAIVLHLILSAPNWCSIGARLDVIRRS